jgi:hypothetical protein
MKPLCPYIDRSILWTGLVKNEAAPYRRLMKVTIAGAIMEA